MANIGSILYTVRSISNGMVTKFSYFEIDSSLEKKLYTAKKQREENDSRNQTNQVSSLLINSEDFVDEREKVRKDINNRILFDYSFSHYCCRVRCCCRWCMSERREERLFLNAQDKLAGEIDLLDITKQLRVAKFASR